MQRLGRRPARCITRCWNRYRISAIKFPTRRVVSWSLACRRTTQICRKIEFRFKKMQVSIDKLQSTGWYVWWRFWQSAILLRLVDIVTEAVNGNSPSHSWPDARQSRWLTRHQSSTVSVQTGNEDLYNTLTELRNSPPWFTRHIAFRYIETNRSGMPWVQAAGGRRTTASWPLALEWKNPGLTDCVYRD